MRVDILIRMQPSKKHFVRIKVHKISAMSQKTTELV